jgi:hypothetical protein
VTFLSGFGTLTVIFGVVMYNEAHDIEKKATNSNTSGNNNNPIITWRDS